MAYFPEISPLDFALTGAGDAIIQAPVEPPSFEFQHTSNFDYYRPCAQDFYLLDPPTNRYAVLRSDLASCFWESLKMKGRYILAAANGWNGATAEGPLPITIPEEKLREIGMTHPPFPPFHQLAYNFLLLPESPDKIGEWIGLWQNNSRQLAAWIAQARLQSSRLPSCSWSWPATPTDPDPVTAPHTLNTTPSHEPESDDEASTENSSLSSAEPDTLFSENPEPPRRVAHAFQVATSQDGIKRSRDVSPIDPSRDGCDANKRQLVLWNPTPAQLIEREQALACGEVSSHYTGPNPCTRTRILSSPIHHISNPTSRVRDPRLRISLLTTDATGSVTLTKPVDGSAINSGKGELFGKV